MGTQVCVHAPKYMILNLPVSSIIIIIPIQHADISTGNSLSRHTKGTFKFGK